jgi:hypothetical protein
MNQFSHRFASPEQWAEPKKAKKRLEETQIARIKRTYGVKLNHASTKLDCDFFRLCWRDLTQATNTRSLISTILPPGVFMVETLPYLRPNYFNGNDFEKAMSYDSILFLCGTFNSFVVDFIIRQRISIHATMSHVLELPIPHYGKNDKYFLDIVQHVGSLICTTPEFDPLKKELKIKKSVTDRNERQTLMAQINAYVAKIYDLSKSELEYVLSTFSVKNEPLKQLVLEEFNKL